MDETCTPLKLALIGNDGNCEIHRLSFSQDDLNYSGVQNRCRELFELVDARRFELYYTDNEGDRLLISNDCGEFAEALRYFKMRNLVPKFEVHELPAENFSTEFTDEQLDEPNMQEQVDVPPEGGEEGMKVFLFESVASGKNLGVKGKDLTVDAKRGCGPFGMWIVERHDGPRDEKNFEDSKGDDVTDAADGATASDALFDYVRLRNVRSATYLRVTGPKHVDSRGSGGSHCVFRVLRNEDDSISLSSVAHEGLLVAMKYNGKVLPPKNVENGVSDPRTRFRVVESLFRGKFRVKRAQKLRNKKLKKSVKKYRKKLRKKLKKVRKCIKRKNRAEHRRRDESSTSSSSTSSSSTSSSSDLEVDGPVDAQQLDHDHKRRRKLMHKHHRMHRRMHRMNRRMQRFLHLHRDALVSGQQDFGFSPPPPRHPVGDQRFGHSFGPHHRDGHGFHPLDRVADHSNGLPQGQNVQPLYVHLTSVVTNKNLGTCKSGIVTAKRGFGDGGKFGIEFMDPMVVHLDTIGSEFLNPRNIVDGAVVQLRHVGSKQYLRICNGVVDCHGTGGGPPCTFQLMWNEDGTLSLLSLGGHYIAVNDDGSLRIAVNNFSGATDPCTRFRIRRAGFASRRQQDRRHGQRHRRGHGRGHGLHRHGWHHGRRHGPHRRGRHHHYQYDDHQQMAPPMCSWRMNQFSNPFGDQQTAFCAFGGNALQAQFVPAGNGSGEGITVSPGEEFSKTWTFRNNSPSSSWPAGCQLIHLRGPNLTKDTSDAIPILSEPLPIPPGKQVFVKVDMVAPPIPGRYISYWRLADHNRELFGERVWASISVKPTKV